MRCGVSINSILSILIVSLLLNVSCGNKQDKGSEEVPSDENETTSYHNDKVGRPSPLAKAEASIDGTRVSIEYSQPAVKSRKIWGNLVKYDRIWRTGANEANILESSGPILINDQRLEPGKYALFTIPSKDSWIVIVNNVYDQWGAYDYDKKEDVMRLTVTPKLVSELQERMTFTIDSLGSLDFAWEYLRFSLPIRKLDE